MAIIEEIQKQSKKQEQDQCKDHDFSTGEKMKETPPQTKAQETRIIRHLICVETLSVIEAALECT